MYSSSCKCHNWRHGPMVRLWNIHSQTRPPREPLETVVPSKVKVGCYLSLQRRCLAYIIHNLDEYSPELLSLLPMKLRKEILTNLPPLDICRLEDSPVVRDVDMNEVWGVINRGLYVNTEYLGLHTSKKDSVEENWRNYFLIQTVQALLHIVNPLRLPDQTRSWSRSHPSGYFQLRKCSYYDLLQRLIAMPPSSKLSEHYSQNDFKLTSGNQFLIIPYRYAEYNRTDGFETILDLLKVLVLGHHFHPRKLVFDCDLMYYSEICQFFMSGWRGANSFWSLFATLLSELEHVEFCSSVEWPKARKCLVVPCDYIPKLVFEALFENPSPKLETVCIETGTVDGCVGNIAPYFSADHHAEAHKYRSHFPTCTPYSGLKSIHIFGVIASEKCSRAISSIILNQSGLVSLELMLTYDATISPQSILDQAIKETIFQPQFQKLTCGACGVGISEDVIHHFVDANQDLEISISTKYYKIVIPARNGNTLCGHKMLDLLYTAAHYTVMSWLQKETAKAEVPLKYNVELLGEGSMEDLFYSFLLSTCQAVKLQLNKVHSICLKNFTFNPNLQSLAVHVTGIPNRKYSFCLWPSKKTTDKVLKLLQAVFQDCPQLNELVLGTSLGSWEGDILNKLFETLVTFCHPEQLTVDLRSNQLTDVHLNQLHEVWRRFGEGKKLKAIVLELSKGMEAKIEEIKMKMEEMSMEQTISVGEIESEDEVQSHKSWRKFINRKLEEKKKFLDEYSLPLPIARRFL